MRILPFPDRGQAGPDDVWNEVLEAALEGRSEGSMAASWRELRDDVRALAPAMSPDFERQLSERIAARSAPRRPRELSPSPAPGSTSATPQRRPARALRLRARFAAMRRARWRNAPAIVTALCVAASIVVLAGPLRGGSHGPRPVPETAVKGTATGARSEAEPTASGSAGTNSAPGGVAEPARPPAAAKSSLNGGVVEELAPSSGAPATAERVQQLAASISLGPPSGEVQEAADRVARVAVSDGGYVQSSHVQVQEGGPGEADLTLRLPSARLSTALASLGALAPVRAESQSLQDITDSYQAARRRVADATAERQALLRALAAARTEGQIDSLRERLAQARSAIAQAQAALGSISQRASTAEVEVTVIGDAHDAGEGLTLQRGLHDAGRVLLVTLIVLLLAAAILVPVALLMGALASARRAWRRYQRERALQPH
jgi:hypothetical protein